MADDNGGARAAILGRIRAANGRTTTIGEADRAWAGIERSYRRSSEATEESVLELLTDRLHDYDAHVLVTRREAVAEAVGMRLAARGEKRVVMPLGIPADLLPPGNTIEVDSGMPVAELDRFDGVLTTAQVAIAETGTLVLQGVPGQGRRAVSLVPDYHLCLLDRADIVATVPEAMDRLQGTASLPTTFISGPSATADIEMTRIKGVHGPRFLDVIVYS
jgi:L-lactate dehydrogenase complex protein LldG